MFDIVVAGEINPDLILTGDVEPVFGQVEKLVDSAALTIGSSAAIFACGAARLGLKVAFVGVCGQDMFGQFMLDEMSKRRVDVRHISTRLDGQTGLSVILNRRTERAILTLPGLIGSLTADQIKDELLRQSRHLHVASYFLQTGLQRDLPALFQRARAFGLTTSLDPNYDPSGRWEGLAEVLPHTSIFLPNRGEALAIARTQDVDAAARHLATAGNLVVIKLGAEGALAAANKRMIRADSIPVAIVDSIGAGDSFDAGFLFGHLEHRTIEASLRLACACGALSMRAAGGTAGQPTLDEAMQHVPG
jgi:sugar/nucleoside kinase (ribokinase family)